MSTQPYTVVAISIILGHNSTSFVNQKDTKSLRFRLPLQGCAFLVFPGWRRWNGETHRISCLDALCHKWP